MASCNFCLKAYSFRTLPTPLETPQGIKTYNCIVPVTEIPKEFLSWMEVNAREPSLNGHVPQAIRKTLNESPDYFVVYNRGLAILAESVEYDNQTHQLRLNFKNKERHGIFDGGHTLCVILNALNNASSENGDGEEQQAFCRIEILTGVPEEMITNIVDARNTSKQVALKSLLDLEGIFEELKVALGREITGLISWHENEEGPIDVRDLISLLTMFDKDGYNDVNHPLISYSSKEACLKRFHSNLSSYKKIFPVAKDILKIWETTQFYVPGQWNNGREEKGKFGNLTGCKKLKTPRELPILGETTQYEFPNGYVYPIVAAFRSMLMEENGTYNWGKGVNPKKLIKEGLAMKMFSASVVNSIRTVHNPNRTGKDSNVWGFAYQIAENYYLKL
jgi:AIPR protein